MPAATPMNAEQRNKDEPMPREALMLKGWPMHRRRLMNKDGWTNKEGLINKDAPTNKDKPTRKLVKTETHRAHPDSIFTQAPILEKRVASETRTRLINGAA
jgi:hypothetical protein